MTKLSHGNISKRIATDDRIGYDWQDVAHVGPRGDSYINAQRNVPNHPDAERVSINLRLDDGTDVMLTFGPSGSDAGEPTCHFWYYQPGMPKGVELYITGDQVADTQYGLRAKLNAAKEQHQ